MERNGIESKWEMGLFVFGDCLVCFERQAQCVLVMVYQLDHRTYILLQLTNSSRVNLLYLLPPQLNILSSYQSPFKSLNDCLLLLYHLIKFLNGLFLIIDYRQQLGVLHLQRMTFFLQAFYLSMVQLGYLLWRLFLLQVAQ